MPRTGRPPKSLLERFYRKFPDRPPDGCWVNPNKHTGRYDTISLEGGRGAKQKGAHIVAYELFVGPVPPGCVIDHKCRNTRCANPAHLEPVTNQENVLRGESYAAQVVRTGRCGKGHNMADAYVKSNGRQCRTCHREYQQKRAKRRAAQTRARRQEQAA